MSMVTTKAVYCKAVRETWSPGPGLSDVKTTPTQ